MRTITPEQAAILVDMFDMRLEAYSEELAEIQRYNPGLADAMDALIAIADKDE